MGRGNKLSRPRHEDVYPLEKLPVDMQERIRIAVAQPKPPSRWLDLGLAQLPSRAWWEWHWQRGMDPGAGRTRLSPDIRRMVIIRDGLVCGICKGEVAADDVHIDHIYPVSRGGTDELSNLQVTHSACNMRKGARI